MVNMIYHFRYKHHFLSVGVFPEVSNGSSLISKLIPRSTEHMYHNIENQSA